MYDRRIVILGRSEPLANNHVGFRLWMTRNLDVRLKFFLIGYSFNEPFGHGILLNAGSVCTH